MPDKLRESLALLPPRSEPWTWISKPHQSRIEKFIRGQSAPTGALSIERPPKNQLRRTIMVGGHPPKPMVKEGGLSDPSPGNDCYDVDILIRPSTIQKSNILLSTKNIASGNRQSGYGNLLRRRFCWRPASNGTRSRRGRPLQAVMSDFTSLVDCIYYRRNRLQKLTRVLKSPRWVFLEQYFEQSNHWLRDVL
jgi:hypothetical protein